MDNKFEKLQRLEKNASLKSLFLTHFAIGSSDQTIYVWAQDDLVAYQQLKNKINALRSKIDARIESNPLDVKSINRDALYLIRDVNEEYYRVKVLTSLVAEDGSTTEPYALVQFIDLGNQEACPLNKLTLSHPSLNDTPPLASRYQLSNVRPHGMGCVPAVLAYLSRYLFVPCLGTVTPVQASTTQLLDLYDPLQAKSVADILTEKRLGILQKPAGSTASALQNGHAPEAIVNGIATLSIGKDATPAAVQLNGVPSQPKVVPLSTPAQKPVAQPQSPVQKPTVQPPPQKPAVQPQAPQVESVKPVETFVRVTPQAPAAPTVNGVNGASAKISLSDSLRVTIAGPKAEPNEAKKVELVKAPAPKSPPMAVTSPVRPPSIKSPAPNGPVANNVDQVDDGSVRGGDAPISKNLAPSPQVRTPNGLVSPPAKNLIKYDLLQKEDTETIFITLCQSSKDFYGQFVKFSEEELTEMGSKIQDWALGAPVANPSDLFEGQAVIAPFDEDGMYYRAVIEKVEGKMAKVFYVDWGNESEIELSRLLILPPQFRRPPFGIRCSWQRVLSSEQEQQFLVAMQETSIQVQIVSPAKHEFDYTVVHLPQIAMNMPIYDAIGAK